ncbi:hypothetical protein JAB5_36390 [Janthinobacterium sp. HH103]|uniref:hypothetical protein n=1 Tax=unclassified Janthinobacterium TaxID=2610881 RepID=UPI0008737F5E|nr:MULTISPECIES: hypothetical protein [unclassified Janthinobacterium]OEZ67435.1 hypothetical protein JAB2_23740 [Janthinobacterium sp. HH100]OEZ72305.1 hypothetical protein JAB5_36390 [Janthinobacterium sp. HH103]OEZ86554.1 hypothetical protein JAB8_33820 [Janthinobacterium sp. HH106]QOU74473.1 hypothetical protein JAB4_039420 [Janthinobacterium sp. HH102]
MKQLFSLALAAGVTLASLPLDAAAQSRPPSAPQEAQAPVPAATYRSAFAGYRPAAEDDATPDQTWRAVNEKVGKAGGHMGMMKMDGHKMDGHKMPMEKPGPKPAAQPAPQHQHEGH